MTDWIHCNSCFTQPSPNNKFFLTDCGHVYCTTCGEKCSNGGCYICAKRCNIIPLSSNMKPEVAAYFSDTTEITKQLLKQSQELNKVIEFQRGHRKRLYSKNKERLEKAKVLHGQFQQACKLIQDLERKLQSAQQENGFLRQQLKMSGKDVSQLGMTQQMYRNVMPRNTRSQAASPTEKIFSSPLSQFQTPIQSPQSVTGRMSGPPSRIIVRTPPSGGKMGVIPGSQVSVSKDSYYTPMSLVGTPNRSMTPTPYPQAARAPNTQMSFSNSQNNVSQCQIRLPGVNRSSGSISSMRKKATVSPYSPQNTPT